MLPIRDHLKTRRFPVVNLALILTNVVVYFGERIAVASGYPAGSLVAGWGLVPEKLLRAPFAEATTLLTSMFLHAPTAWLHLAGNMLFLWIFGDNVEDALGRGRYLVFYLLAGLGAAAAQILVDPVPMVGASGAIAGVVAAYGSLYPTAPVTVLNPVPLLWPFFGVFPKFPAWVVIVEFFVFNAWQGLRSIGGASEVAFFAHLGGFVAGLLLVRLFATGKAVGETPRRRFPAGSREGAVEGRRRGPWAW